MFGKKLVADMISRSAENEHDRRSFLRSAGVAGLGTVGAVALAGASTESARTTSGDRRHARSSSRHHRVASHGPGSSTRASIGSAGTTPILASPAEVGMWADHSLG